MHNNNNNKNNNNNNYKFIASYGHNFRGRRLK